MHQWFFSFLPYSAMPFVALNNVGKSLLEINYFMFLATFTFTDTNSPYQGIRTKDRMRTKDRYPAWKIR
jgi:hypothetical protein